MRASGNSCNAIIGLSDLAVKHGAVEDRATLESDLSATAPPAQGKRAGLKAVNSEGRGSAPEEPEAPRSSLEPSRIKLQDDTKVLPVGHSFITLYCANCGYQHRVVLECGDRTCPHCRARGFWRLFRGYEESIKPKQNLKSVTLTLKNVPDGRLGEVVDRQREAFKKLRRREPYARIWVGGIYAIECVNKGRGWNVHMHLIVEGGFVPQARLADDWYKITGDSMVVHIQHVRNPKAVLWHALKYVTKRPTLQTVRHEAEYNLVLKGRRMIQTWGSWWGEVLIVGPPVVVCPRCGSTKWISEFEIAHLGVEAWQRAPPFVIKLLYL